jgi:hypothetical protein
MKTSSRSLRPIRVFLLILAVAASTGGCRTTGGGAASNSKAAALGSVHKIYQEEFAAVALPGPSQRPSAPTNEQAFQRTVAAINEFKKTHGTDGAEAAHLSVLEGMAYLQSGQIGRARLMREEVKQAAPKLRSSDGSYTRDELLARSFEPLLTGWEQVRNAGSGSNVSPSSTQFKQAADGIEEVLTGLDARRLAAPEVDAGAKYLATSSAIFRVWYGSMQRAQKAAAYQQGATLVGRFLSAEEKQAAETNNVAQLPAPRQRFAAWYRFLRQASPGS